jgi:hypothetical protein
MKLEAHAVVYKTSALNLVTHKENYTGMVVEYMMCWLVFTLILLLFPSHLNVDHGRILVNRLRIKFVRRASVRD